LFGIDSPSQWRLAESGVEKYNGTVINDKGFMSTTINSEAVADGNVNYYIKLPEGSNAMPIWGLSEYRDEREVLIDKDSKFIVENVESEHISGYQYNFNVYMTLLK
jgi:antibiotic biosynthesis monooxygenase (ABM) superfamily enzyme